MADILALSACLNWKYLWRYCYKCKFAYFRFKKIIIVL